MKNLFWILLFISCQCYAQTDICAGITQEENKVEGQLIYHTPLVGKTTILSLTKTIEDTSASFSIYIGLILDAAPKSGNGTSLKLADGTIIRDEASLLKITEVDLGKYALSGSLNLEDGKMDVLTDNLVVSADCGGVERAVPEKEARLFQAYIRCLADR